MAKNTDTLAILFAFALMVFQIYPMSASCEFFNAKDAQQSAQPTRIRFSDTLDETLQKIKTNTHVPSISLHHVKDISLNELQQINLSILPDDKLFDSWIDLISELFITGVKDSDFDRSLKLAKEKGECDAATAHAQCNLGFMYEYGYGVEQNHTKAMACYQQAATQGRADAFNNIGHMCRYGRGVEQNFYKAFKYYQEAVDQGSLCALINVGYMYRYGYGVERNLTQAFQHYQQAANYGYTSALRVVGDMYHRGQGVPQDLSQALKYYLESYKFNTINSSFEDDLKEAIKSLVTFKRSTTPRTPRRAVAHVMIHQEALKKDLNDFLMVHCLEEGVNNCHSKCIESKFALANVFEVYQKITTFEQNLLNVIKAFQQPGFMVSCLQPRDKKLFESNACSDIQFYEFRGKSYLTFGEDNVEAAKELMAIVSNVTPSCDQAVSDILNLLNKILTSCEHHTELSGDAKALKQQYMDRLQLQQMLKNNALDANHLSSHHKKLIKMITKQKVSLEELQALPQRLRELVQNSVFCRNALFLKTNAYIVSAFK